MTSTVTGKRQIIIPVESAKELHIKTGMQIKWEKGDDRHSAPTILPARSQLLSSAREIGRKYTHGEVSSMNAKVIAASAICRHPVLIHRETHFTDIFKAILNHVYLPDK